MENSQIKLGLIMLLFLLLFVFYFRKVINNYNLLKEDKLFDFKDYNYIKFLPLFYKFHKGNLEYLFIHFPFYLGSFQNKKLWINNLIMITIIMLIVLIILFFK